MVLVHGCLQGKPCSSSSSVCCGGAAAACALLRTVTRTPERQSAQRRHVIPGILSVCSPSVCFALDRPQSLKQKGEGRKNTGRANEMPNHGALRPLASFANITTHCVCVYMDVFM